MPTASPSISASSGVVEAMVSQWVAMKIADSDRPAPRRAAISGMPAATTDRKVRISTPKATAMPSSSVTLMPAVDEEKTWPPTATCDPGGSAFCSALPAAWSDALVLGSTAVVGTDSWIGTRAADPSVLTFPVDGPEYGDEADVT